MKILVVEDEPLILKIIEFKLKQDGYEVFLCVDGKEALKSIELNQPDLVITDIMLPFASGLEIISAVKAMPHKRIPVIVLSAMGQESTVEEAFQLGADDYITKPFSLTELNMRIKRLMKAVHTV